MAARVSFARASRSIASAITRPARHSMWAPRTCQIVPEVRAFSATALQRAKLFNKDHEWIEVSADGKIGTLGISVYAADQLGDIVFVELPEVDAEVSADDTIGSVESVKSVSDFNTPVSGKIIEANAAVEESPGTINQDPEGEGWIAKIELSDKAELDGLMSPEAYETFTKEES